MTHRATKASDGRSVLASLGALVLALASSCGGPNPKRLDFTGLRPADRIQIVEVWTGETPGPVITDAATTARVIVFIEQRQDGWSDVWTGPRGPRVLLKFYAGEKYIDHFGLSENYLVAGSLSRDTDADEIAALARGLGIKWPPG